MVIDRQYVESHKSEIIEAIRNGSVFIYPTDTIYGLGANAENALNIQKIKDIKKREGKPFSVIAPSKEWILEHCEVVPEALDKYLPGPYTLFVKRKDDRGVSFELNPYDNTLGVRIPDHWLARIIAEAGVPFITTSVNLSGKPFMRKLEDVSEEILSQADYVVYEGEKSGEPSTKISLVSPE